MSKSVHEYMRFTPLDKLKAAIYCKSPLGPLSGAWLGSSWGKKIENKANFNLGKIDINSL
jgi:hypothetical protein